LCRRPTSSPISTNTVSPHAHGKRSEIIACPWHARRRGLSTEATVHVHGGMGACDDDLVVQLSRDARETRQQGFDFPRTNQKGSRSRGIVVTFITPRRGRAVQVQRSAIHFTVRDGDSTIRAVQWESSRGGGSHGRRRTPSFSSLHLIVRRCHGPPPASRRPARGP
jgi:hypothetical protein